METRKQYTKEFKLDAISLVVDQWLTIAEASKSGLTESAIYVVKPDQVDVSVITYIWIRKGWLYLAIVIDLFSRKVVGWGMSSRMKATLVCDALRMAIWLRRPPPGLIAQQDILHAYRRVL